jgi:uncharacterized protein (DUF1697 family)
MIRVFRYVALLRAVNVGGTGKLPMADLKAMCRDAGLGSVQTYIASGNVVFTSRAVESRVKAELEARLRAYAGKPVGVMVRTAEEIAAVLAANPFPDAPPNRAMVIFLDEAPPPDALDRVSGVDDEEFRLGRRAIYVHCPSGVGRSKLKIPAAKAGTMRNMKTAATLAEMAAKL